MLEKFQRIELPLPVDQWLMEALTGSEVIALPVDGTIAKLAAQLPYHHKDPADRFIIATSIINNIKLLSLDRQFASYIELKDLLINAI